MDTQSAETSPATEKAPHGVTPAADEQHFETVVRDALEGVGGVLLFKMRFEQEGGGEHVAAASVGDGDNRRFLLLTLPAGGEKLRVEPAARSKSPLAMIAASYAGLAEAMAAA